MNKKHSSTPEHYLQPKNTRGEKSLDDLNAITCALNRAQGICGMLATILDGSEYTFSNSDVCNSLWAVEGLIDQVMILTLGKEMEIKS